MEKENIIYDNLIKRLCCYGRQDKAVHLLDIMLRKGNIPSCTSYAYLIQGFCRCHKLNEALDLHREMLHRNLHPSIHTLSTLVQKVCADGKRAEAEVLLASMVETGEIPSKEMYCTVIYNKFCFEKNFSKASELLESTRQNGYEPDFATHWSLIRNLSISSDKDSKNRPRLTSLCRRWVFSEGGPDPWGQNIGTKHNTICGCSYFLCMLCGVWV